MSIQVRNVSKSFGDFHALDDVTVDIDSGQLTAVLGPSGGGKSTLLRIIAGLETADSGTVFIDGTDVTNVAARDRGIGFVFQHYAAFTHMTVWDNVAFGLKVAKTPKPRIRERVGELLKLVHLDGLANRYPSELSGGQRQRMALARALAVEPGLLLLDEPFGALDVKVRQELREWLRRLHDEVHTTTIFVTHDQEEAMEISDQIIVINNGQVEQAGTPDQLYDQPANDFVMGFLGPVTELGDGLVRPHDIHVVARAVAGRAGRRRRTAGVTRFRDPARRRPGRRRPADHGAADPQPDPRARPQGRRHRPPQHLPVDTRCRLTRCRRSVPTPPVDPAGLSHSPMSLFSNGSVHISAKTDYAIRATIELAAAGPEGSLTAHAIADAQRIPLRFLLNILADLRRVGLVESRRGPSGGWWLSRPADTITVADVIRAVDGPLAEVSGSRPDRAGRPAQRGLGQRPVGHRTHRHPQHPRADHRRRPGQRRAAHGR